ncbi:hypothetical protein BP5796_11636 [Coleophoma crateriformis]|uniref:DUF7514 domain-containing protein n=1 Tax=Coleophoma crateriformis TaxID=565419 RepID=A0A3D8QED8_9HELO|nr:hypothetical protein BP5796_11636 [Coleophoma crateriformis]
MVLKESGYVVPGAPGFPARVLPPPLPPRRDSVALSTKQAAARVVEMPTADWGSLWNIMKAPLEKEKSGKKEKKGRMGGWMKDLGRVGGSTFSMGSGGPNENGSRGDQPPSNDSNSALPPSPPKSVHHGIEREDSSMPSYPEPANWEPLFEADLTPKPIFVALMSTIFGKLDSEHTGYLTPEVYSSFLDLQGTDLQNNTWKLALEKAGDKQCKDVADLELSLYFADMKVSHELNIRSKIFTPSETAAERPASATEQRIKDSMTFSANMPMLSRQGFIDLSAMQYLKDPSKGHEELAKAVSTYGIWKDLCEMPRSVLPESKDDKDTVEEKPEAKAESKAGEEFEEQDLYGADETKVTAKVDTAPAKEEAEKKDTVEEEKVVVEPAATEKGDEVETSEAAAETVEADSKSEEDKKADPVAADEKA